jgi:Uncharacterized protein conserved in bacteria C-term(DUF2220)
VTGPQRTFLKRLRDAGTSGIQRSSIPKTCKEMVDALLICGAISYKPSPSGRGNRLCVVEGLAFQRFIEGRLPKGLDIDDDDLTDRASAIYLLADAKTVKQSTGQGIFVRSVKAGVSIGTTDGYVSVAVGDLTERAGTAAIQLSDSKEWSFAGQVAVIENLDAYWKYEAVLSWIDLAVFANGRMSQRLLRWLASPALERCVFTHWGDYDPVGVSEYVRLSKHCPGRVTVYAPPEVDILLPTHGKRSLVTDQRTYLDQLRSNDNDDYVRRMIGLFDKYRRGLEQEIFLLDSAHLSPPASISN